MNYFDVDILIADKLPELLPKVDGDEINADDVDTITRLCEAVSSFIDRYCKRRTGYFAAAVYTGGPASPDLEITDAGVAGVIGNYFEQGEYNGRPFYAIEGDAGNADTDPDDVTGIYWNGSTWGVSLKDDFSGTVFFSTDDVATPDLVTTWQIVGFGAEPFPVIALLDGEAATEPVIEAGTVRRYRGEGKRYLRIGNHVAGSVSITSPVIAADRYYEHDSNGWLYALDTNFNDEGDYFTSGDCFWEAGRPYEITAVWKFDPSPADVIEAGSQIVAAIWDKGKGVVGEVTPAGFVVDRDIPLTAAALLKPYIKRPFEID